MTPWKSLVSLMLIGSLTTSEAANAVEMAKRRMEEIRIPEAYFPGMLLSEVVNDLNEQMGETSVGLGFRVLLPSWQTGRIVEGWPPKSREPKDVGQIYVFIEKAMQKQSLATVLEAVKGAVDQPIRFEYVPYGVVIQPVRSTVGSATTTKQARIHEFLRQIVIPEIAYDDLELHEIVPDLNWQVRRWNEKKRSFEIIIHSAISNNVCHLPLPEFDLSVEQALDAVVRTTKPPIDYRVDPYAVVLEPRRTNALPLVTRSFVIDRKKLKRRLKQELRQEAFIESADPVEMGLRRYLLDAAAAERSHQPSAVQPIFSFSLRNDLLSLRTTPPEMRRLRSLIEWMDIQATNRPMKAWGRVIEKPELVRKLVQIQIPKFSHQHTNLQSVVFELIETCKRNDPERTGINFVLTDSALWDAPIHLPPSLTNLSLFQLLNQVVAGSSKPMHYVVEDYAIVFEPEKLPARNERYTVRFRVDPKVFFGGLASVTSQPLRAGFSQSDPNDLPPQDRDSLLGDFFVAAGVSSVVNTNRFPVEGFRYDHDRGEILMRGKLQDIDIAHQALDLINAWAQ